MTDRTQGFLALGFIGLFAAILVAGIWATERAQTEERTTQARATLEAAQNWTEPSDSARIVGNNVWQHRRTIVDELNLMTEDEFRQMTLGLHQLYVAWRFTSDNPYEVRDAMKSCTLFGFSPQDIIALHPDGGVDHVRRVMNGYIDECVVMMARFNNPDLYQADVDEYKAMLEAIDANTADYDIRPVKVIYLHQTEPTNDPPAPGRAALGDM